MRVFACIVSTAGCLFFMGLMGCRSAYVQTTVINSSKVELHNIEVDYPSASFGISSLAAGAKFRYRFQIQDAGHMKVEYTDSTEHSHSGKGPYLTQGQRGTLEIDLNAGGTPNWKVEIHPAMSESDSKQN